MKFSKRFFCEMYIGVVLLRVKIAMKKYILIFSFLCSVIVGFSQEVSVDSTTIDTQYREDQFYLSFTYNLLTKKPENLSQSGFSSGLHAGFIRDFPINKKRTFAIGIGVGYAVSTFNQNMLINRDASGNTEFSILDQSDINYSKNKFSTHTLEFPIEFRWRNSTPTSYNFWRIYTGVKMGYVFAHGTKFKGDLGSLKYQNITEFNQFQYGLTLSFGYNTWNAHFYYALNPIFDSSAKLEGNTLDLSVAKIGLIFYIL